MLATIGIVDCIFRRIGRHPSRFHFCAWGTAVSLPSERDGTERKRHRFSDSYCTYSECTGIYEVYIDLIPSALYMHVLSLFSMHYIHVHEILGSGVNQLQWYTVDEEVS